MSKFDSQDLVLKDLEDRKLFCAEEINRLTEQEKTLTQAISSLRQIYYTQQQPHPVPQRMPDKNNRSEAHSIASPIPAPGIYLGISTRWAILYLLAENASEPMGRAEIAKALIDGGMISGAQSFASNVSAVLSGMANERKEVEQVENGGYVITPHGRDVWEGIKRTPQWNARAMMASL